MTIPTAIYPNIGVWGTTSSTAVMGAPCDVTGCRNFKMAASTYSFKDLFSVYTKYGYRFNDLIYLFGTIWNAQTLNVYIHFPIDVTKSEIQDGRRQDDDASHLQ